MTVKLQHRSKDGIAYLTPIGSLDHAAAGELQRQLLAAVDEGETRLALDLAQVSLIDSSGLGTIVAGFKAARAAGGSLVLVNVNRDIQSIIRLTRLDKVLAVCADEQEVERRLAARRGAQ